MVQHALNKGLWPDLDACNFLVHGYYVIGELNKAFQLHSGMLRRAMKPMKNLFRLNFLNIRLMPEVEGGFCSLEMSKCLCL